MRNITQGILTLRVVTARITWSPQSHTELHLPPMMEVEVNLSWGSVVKSSGSVNTRSSGASTELSLTRTRPLLSSSMVLKVNPCSFIMVATSSSMVRVSSSMVKVTRQRRGELMISLMVLVPSLTTANPRSIILSNLKN